MRLARFQRTFFLLSWSFRILRLRRQRRHATSSMRWLMVNWATMRTTSSFSPTPRKTLTDQLTWSWDKLTTGSASSATASRIIRFIAIANVATRSVKSQLNNLLFLFCVNKTSKPNWTIGKSETCWDVFRCAAWRHRQFYFPLRSVKLCVKVSDKFRLWLRENNLLIW